MQRPLPPPDMPQLLSEIADDDSLRLFEVFSEGRPVDDKGRYLHWDQMRHRQPPEGLTLKEWWARTAVSRMSQARTLPVTGTDGEPFRFTNIDRIQEMVHRIDQQASGRIETDDIVANVGSRNRYLVSSLPIISWMLVSRSGALAALRVAVPAQSGPRGDRDHVIAETLDAHRHHRGAAVAALRASHRQQRARWGPSSGPASATPAATITAAVTARSPSTATTGAAAGTRSLAGQPRGSSPTPHGCPLAAAASPSRPAPTPRRR